MADVAEFKESFGGREQTRSSVRSLAEHRGHGEKAWTVEGFIFILFGPVVWLMGSLFLPGA